VLNKVLEKLWWRWIKDLDAPWAQIWKEKYASNWKTKDPIRMSVVIKGYHIWNKSWENRGIVQKNRFWEIGAGDLAWFWEDKWQQEPKLLREDFVDLKNDTDTKALQQAKYFWDQTNSEGKWRTWNLMEYMDNSSLKAKVDSLIATLDQRKILISIDQGQLRWEITMKAPLILKRQSA